MIDRLDILVIKTPIQSTSRHELARINPVDLGLPWTSFLELLKDKDFVQLTIVTQKDTYTITKDSSW